MHRPKERSAQRRCACDKFRPGGCHATFLLDGGRTGANVPNFRDFVYRHPRCAKIGTDVMSDDWGGGGARVRLQACL
jgi:hypothetical protein